MGGMYSPLFVAGNLPGMGAPVFDPFSFGLPPISVPISIPDPFGGGGGGISMPFQPVGGVPTSPMPGMPAPIQMTGKCLLRGHRRMNWANFRALNRAGRRLHAFNKHARKYIKITRNVRVGKRRRRK